MISPYIKALRGKIGHDLLLLPSVTILVFNERHEVLLVRHSDQNVWVAPGGMIEPDETPAAAAVREMQEETGCVVELLKIIGVYGGQDFRIRYQNGDEVSYVMTVYEARISDGTLQPDSTETLEARFVSYEETKEIACGKWLPVVLRSIYEPENSQSDLQLITKRL